MERILITGATGFLGGALARRLRQDGRIVRATGRNAVKGAELGRAGIDFRAIDLAADPGGVRQLVQGCEAVVHCAALSSPWGRYSDFEAANVTATHRVVDACRMAGIRRLVHVSSPSVMFDFKVQQGLREDTPWVARPANHYIATKRRAESLVLGAAGYLDILVLRPRALFGRGDTTLLPRVVRVARKGAFPLIGEGDPLMDLTAIDDAVAAIMLALGAPATCRGKVYHVTSGNPQPQTAAIGTLLEACGLPVRFRRVSLIKARWVATIMEMISNTCTLGHWEPPLTRYSVGALGYEQTLDISAARLDLGYAPTTNILTALKQTGSQWRSEVGS